MPESSTVKEEARRLVESLPDDVTWDEFVEKVQERRLIEQGRADVAAGRFVSTDELLEKFGLKR